MKNKHQLLHKVRLLLRRAKAPTYWHKHGPKTYQLWQHVFALFVKNYCQLSYRDTSYFLESLGFEVATKSTLQRYAKRLSLPFWQTLLHKSTRRPGTIACIDGTGYDKTIASIDTTCTE